MFYLSAEWTENLIKTGTIIWQPYNTTFLNLFSWYLYTCKYSTEYISRDYESENSYYSYATLKIIACIIPFQ